jgi:hypothetical protein
MVTKREFADGHRGTETQRVRRWPTVWVLNLQIDFVALLLLQ